MIPKNGDKWWALLLVIVCVFFAANLYNDIGQRRESSSQRREIVTNQGIIMSNQSTIMNGISLIMTNAHP